MAERSSTALPRGRHNLSREEVAEVQRDRMLEGVAHAMAEKGYVGTSVGDIIKRAGVSRETFYQQFASKQECFIAAFDVAGDLLLSLFESIVEEQAPAADRLRKVLDAYIDGIIAHEPFARLFLVEAFAAGPEALARRTAVQQRVSNGMVELLDLDPTDDELRLACDLIVAGLGSIVTMPLITGDHERLRALVPPLVDLILHQLAATR